MALDICYFYVKLRFYKNFIFVEEEEAELPELRSQAGYGNGGKEIQHRFLSLNR